MENLNFDDGSITLCINQDQSRAFTFYPSDVKFAERFYNLMKEFQVKEKELLSKAKVLDAKAKDDDYVDELFKFNNELDIYFKEKLDYVFGEGMSQISFNGVNVMSISKGGKTILENFLVAIVPYIENGRAKEMKSTQAAKYKGRKK